ncbi:MAG: Uncharacterized protein Greene071421_9 [Parcubacteria group bacterium Greene0714_21]|nr:MAG: Uncharacterized protein Greene041639_407 [Parcubacteria group bacterium Greene0416_39]TSD04523.1 MAG: Uncharacterized protein Greene071421_9 [Parcubacteria group bacterium Greene0714_21]
MKVIPREVGRRVNTNSRALRDFRENLNRFTPYQERVLFGTLLGDACLLPNGWETNWRLQIGHGERQKAYLWWKYKVFENWVFSKPKFQAKTSSWRFRTISHPELTRWHKVFYRRGRKILPKDLGIFLRHPIVLAVWFMDDGGKLKGQNGKDHGLLLNVQRLSLKQVKVVQKIFRESLGLDSTHQWNNSGYRLYFGKASKEKFNNIVRKFVHPSLRYKLLTP